MDRAQREVGFGCCADSRMIVIEAVPDNADVAKWAYGQVKADENFLDAKDA